jgi:hypothetical protein
MKQLNLTVRTLGEPRMPAWSLREISLILKQFIDYSSDAPVNRDGARLSHIFLFGINALQGKPFDVAVFVNHWLKHANAQEGARWSSASCRLVYRKPM